MERPIYIDLLSDWGFKRIFGRKGSSEEFLRDFLNELFYGDPILGSIEKVEFTNVDKAKSYKRGKGVRYDIICETDKGHRFIVEMQRRDHNKFPQRVMYYLCREIVEQGIRETEKEHWTFSIMPVVGVFVTEFDLPGFEGRLKIQGRILDTETHATLLEDIKCAFIQLKNFDKRPEECVTGFDKWVFILKNMEKLREVPFRDYKEGLFNRVAEISRVANLSRTELREYEDELKAIRIKNAEIDFSREQGRAEGKLEVARNMKALGLDTTTIVKSTGLTAEEIEKL